MHLEEKRVKNAGESYGVHCPCLVGCVQHASGEAKSVCVLLQAQENIFNY